MTIHRNARRTVAAITLVGTAFAVAACDVRTSEVPAVIIPAWRVVPLLPNSCQLVTKLDADGIVRTRYEDGRQSPCDPANFDPSAR